TDGRRLLCTSPEKDVGFPYRSLFGQQVANAMAIFSWQTFLIDTGQWTHWIDAGRLAPNHSALCEYLKWVAMKCHLTIIAGSLKRVLCEDNAWSVTYISQDGTEQSPIRAAAIVITGRGEPWG